MDELRYIQTIRDTGDELEHYIDQDGERLSTFGPISRINILVGATNSGKSRFMRGLARSPTYVLCSGEPGTTNPSRVLNICKRLSGEDFHVLIEVNPDSGEYDPEALTADLPWLKQHLKPATKGTMQQAYLTKRDFARIRGLLIQELTNPRGGTERQRRRGQLNDLAQAYRFALLTSDRHTVDREWLSLQIKGLTKGTRERVETVLEFLEALSSLNLHMLTPPKVVYIPVLRTAVPLKEISTSNEMDPLAQSFSANYALGSDNAQVEVFTGNLLYGTIQRERSGDPEIHKRLRDFERFLGETFFEGMSISLVPLDVEYAPGRHLALFIDEQTQRRFHDVGDGIQAIIILTYRLFTAERGTWLFIEEPEQGLHPGLQRIFLETIARDRVLQERNLTIFISTHSNHLLGMAVSELEKDVSVFAFQRWTNPERFEIRPVHTRQQSLLALLGVANSSVLLANCGIWVEGITDRKYLRAYLSAYLQSEECKEKFGFVPREDVHYAFFEYAGSNLVHYLFESEEGAPSDQAERIRAQFLCNRIFLLADQDEGKDEKHERLKASQGDSFTYYVTPGTEVENLISEVELSQALPQLISGLTQEDVVNAKIRFSDYCRKRIGLYLKEAFGDLCPDSLRTLNGALSAYYKDRLASLVCPNVTWDNMSPDARDLTRDLYRFIYEHNQVAPKLGS